MKKSLLLFVAALFAMFVLANCGGGGGGGAAGFFSGPSEAPGSFTLTTPGDGDSSIAQPVLAWTASPHAAVYTVQIASAPTFTAPLVWEKTIAVPFTSLVSQVTLTTDATYYWRVTATNSIGSTLATAATHSYSTFTVRTSGGVQWVRSSNPVPSQDAEPFAMAIDASYMYVAGYDFGAANNDDRWRIEKRSLLTGDLVPSFGNGAGFVTSNTGTASFEDVWAMAVNASDMYLVGEDNDNSGNQNWLIEKRSLATGALVNAFGSNGLISENTGTPGSNQAMAVALDSSSLYVAGFDGWGDGNQWRLEKRDLLSGATDTLGFGSSGVISDASVTAPSAAYAVAVASGPTGSVYTAGYYTSGSRAYWYLDKRNKATGAKDGSFAADLATPTIEGAVYAMLIKDTYIYLAGYQTDVSNNQHWHIEQRNLDNGALVTSVDSDPSAGADIPNAIATDGTFIYVAGFDSGNPDDVPVADGQAPGQWRIEKYDLDLTLQTSFGLNGAAVVNPSNYDDQINAIAANADGVYVAGRAAPGNIYQWRIEKRTR